MPPAHFLNASTLFGNTPQCGEGNGIVPHNQSRNLSVLPSFSAQDAAAFWRLFGAMGMVPRNAPHSVNVCKNFPPQQAALRSQPPDHRRLPAPSNKSEAFFLSLWGPGGRNPRSPFASLTAIIQIRSARRISAPDFISFFGGLPPTCIIQFCLTQKSVLGESKIFEVIY